MNNDRNVEFFRGIADLINSVADLDNLLNMLIVTATRVTGARASSLLLVDKKTDNLYFHIAIGDKTEKIKQFALKKGEGIAGWVAKHNKPLLVKDVNSDPRWSPKVSASVGFETKSIACAPLRDAGEVIGVLEIIDRDDGETLREEDMERLQAFSDLAAAALVKARSFNSVEKRKKELQSELAEKHRIIGDSPAIKKAIEDCRKVAGSKATTLITGDSGTGKELFARLIHELSPRKDNSLIVVNCGALPETLLERELFGHEKGAFTDADSQKIGLFEAADGGTIFLDEIGETTQAMQVKLLRVLQEEVFFRIGGQSSIKVDVRVIAATNKNLEEMVASHEFREDLYYRLNVIRLKLPSLKERKSDIPILTERFIRRMAGDLNRSIKGVTPDAMNALKSYSWPGNIRQLENAVERAVIMGDSEWIGLDDLPPEITEVATQEIQVGLTLKEAQDNFKKNFIVQSLEFQGGNKTRTAKMLDIQRTYLSRLIKELEIE